jgi:hypothetical protein
MSDDRDMMDPPRYDMLTVKFRGDNHEITLPYCEVANGDIAAIAENRIDISVKVPENPEVELEEDNSKTELVSMPFKNFVEAVEKTFDIKEIVSMSLQMAWTYDQIRIL